MITESADSGVFAWYVKPGQRISAYVRPDGQDKWIVLAGCGRYQVNANGDTLLIEPGDVVVAHRDEVHGVINDGALALESVLVVSPAAAGIAPFDSTLPSA